MPVQFESWQFDGRGSGAVREPAADQVGEPERVDGVGRAGNVLDRPPGPVEGGLALHLGPLRVVDVDPGGQPYHEERLPLDVAAPAEPEARGPQADRWPDVGQPDADLLGDLPDRALL